MAELTLRGLDRLIAAGQYVGGWPPGHADARSIRIGYQLIPVSAEQLRVWRAVRTITPAIPGPAPSSRTPQPLGASVDQVIEACGVPTRWQPALSAQRTATQLRALVTAGVVLPAPLTDDETVDLAGRWRAVPQLNAAGASPHHPGFDLGVTTADGSAVDVRLSTDTFDRWTWLGADRDLLDTAGRAAGGGPVLTLSTEPAQVAAAVDAARFRATATVDAVRRAVAEALQLLRSGAAYLDLADPGSRPPDLGRGLPAAAPLGPAAPRRARRSRPEPTVYPIGQSLGRWRRTEDAPMTFRVRLGAVCYELSAQQWRLWTLLRVWSRPREIERHASALGIGDPRSPVAALRLHGLVLTVGADPAQLTGVRLCPTLSSVDVRGAADGSHGTERTQVLGPRGTMRELLLFAAADPDLAVTLDAAAGVEAWPVDGAAGRLLLELSHELEAETAYLDLAQPVRLRTHPPTADRDSTARG